MRACVECVIYLAEVSEGLGTAARSACEGRVFLLRGLQVKGSLCFRYYWIGCGGIVVDFAITSHGLEYGRYAAYRCRVVVWSPHIKGTLRGRGYGLYCVRGVRDTPETNHSLIVTRFSPSECRALSWSLQTKGVVAILQNIGDMYTRIRAT